MSKTAPGPIVTTAAGVPRKCPACWQTVPTRTSESGGVTRLTCPNCQWSERYLILEKP